MRRLLLLLALLLPGLSFAQGSSHEQNLSVLGVPPGATGVYCINWASLTAVPSYTTLCPGSGGGSSNFNVNGTALSSSTTVNFQNSTVTGGLTFTVANPSGGNIQLGISGWPSSLVSNDCLTNNGTTISWGGCGGSNFQVNGSNLFSQTTVNFLNSAATNGQTFTFTNPTAGSVQLGVSGTLTTGGGGTGIASTPANGQVLIGNGSGYSLATITAGSNITVTNSAGGITIAAPGGTGVTSATGSGAVSVSPTTGAAIVSLTAQSNNTILGNASGSSASPTALTAAQAIGVLTSGTPNAQTGTSYTLAIGDANGEVTMNNASANTLTIPTNASVAFAIGTVITVQQLGTGLTSVTPASGVTFQSPQFGSSSTQSYPLGGAYGFIQLQKAATNTWNVIAFTQANNAGYTLSGTCTSSANNGPYYAGTITMSSAGNCTIIITPLGTFPAPHGWTGTMHDRTQPTVPAWGESSASTTAITFTVPTAVATSDVIAFGPLTAY